MVFAARKLEQFFLRHLYNRDLLLKRLRHYHYERTLAFSLFYVYLVDAPAAFQ